MKYTPPHKPAIGTRNGRSRLANKYVRWARMGRRIGLQIRGMAGLLRVDPSTLGKAIKGKTWAHVK